MKILDCTLRDGGYYNNWDFSADIVAEYLKAMAEAGVDYVELGLRNFAREGFLGAHAYTTERYLNHLELPVGPTYGVMVDAKTILSSKLSASEAVRALFVPRSESKVELVRVAAHFEEVDECAAIVAELSFLGYTIGFNLMQAGGRDAEVISAKAREVSSWNVVECLYFADSFGNMNESEVNRIVDAIRMEWSGTLGIHTHNNMGKAIDNTFAAYEAGALWLDVTVTGMGRGAGNAQTEYLLALMSKVATRYNPSPIYRLAIQYFEPMQRVYGWGTNLLYFLGAQHNIHPTYIQSILSDTHYGISEIVGCIDYLCSYEESSKFSRDILEKALAHTSSGEISRGKSEIGALFDGREVLLVASGPGLRRYKQAVIDYILDHRPVVLCINVTEELSDDYIDYYCISHNVRFLSEKEKYSSLAKPVIYPAHRFAGDSDVLNPVVAHLDYGVEVQRDEFLVRADHAVIPFDLTVAYAAAFCKAAGSIRLSLVGFDGYESTDPRQNEMVRFFGMAIGQGFAIRALTPTSYPIPQESIYAPHV